MFSLFVSVEAVAAMLNSSFLCYLKICLVHSIEGMNSFPKRTEYIMILQAGKRDRGGKREYDGGV